MTPIRITAGRYAGRILRSYDLSSDQRYAQVWIGKSREEFKLGLDCEWVRS